MPTAQIKKCQESHFVQFCSIQVFKCIWEGHCFPVMSVVMWHFGNYSILLQVVYTIYNKTFINLQTSRDLTGKSGDWEIGSKIGNLGGNASCKTCRCRLFPLFRECIFPDLHSVQNANGHTETIVSEWHCAPIIQSNKYRRINLPTSIESNFAYYSEKYKINQIFVNICRVQKMADLSCKGHVFCLRQMRTHSYYYCVFCYKKWPGHFL